MNELKIENQWIWRETVTLHKASGRHVVSSFVSEYCFATLSRSVWAWRQQLWLCVYWSQHLVINYCRLWSLDVWIYQQHQVSHCQCWLMEVKHCLDPVFLMMTIVRSELRLNQITMCFRNKTIRWQTLARYFDITTHLKNHNAGLTSYLILSRNGEDSFNPFLSPDPGHQNRRLCSRPHSHELAIVSYFWHS